MGATVESQNRGGFGQSLSQDPETRTSTQPFANGSRDGIYNRTFQRWLKDQGVKHFSTEGDAKASVVERFNRTLKERLYCYFTIANTLRFDDVLPELVQGYNATRHRSIGMAPQDVTWENEEAVWKRLYDKRLKGKRSKPKFQVGDRVRLNKIHRTFEKGYLPGWTEEVFVVHRVTPGPVPTYKISRMG